MKKLYRSKKNRWLTGLCGGIGEYFGINPLIVRVVAALMELSVFGLIAYFVLAYCIPQEPECNEVCLEEKQRENTN